MRFSLTRVTYLALFVSSAVAQSPPQRLAFPGAEGYGRLAVGGRLGKAFHVTTLADSGPGSLRDAVSQPNRIVVFDVGGYILLKDVLKVSSNITIAGQSAPGDGIGIAGAEVSLNGVHDVVIRYVRVRQGMAAGEDKKSAINITDGQNIILDHVSVQWGRWDTIDMHGSNITTQHCIVGEGVDPQRFGCLCESDPVTFSHNLWIDQDSRNPKAKGRVQYINNIVYGWGKVGLVGGHSAADHTMDVIGNYFIAGPGSSVHFLGEFTATDHVYQTGNFADTNHDGQLNGREVMPADFGAGAGSPTFFATGVVKDPAPVTIISAEAAYKEAIADAGDSLHRDAVDTRLIAQLTSLGKDGKIIHDPAEIGGLGALSGGPAPRDTDGDGIPDDWETAHGLNPNDPADASKLDGEGYSMLEEYLNGLAAGDRR